MINLSYGKTKEKQNSRKDSERHKLIYSSMVIKKVVRFPHITQLIFALMAILSSPHIVHPQGKVPIAVLDLEPIRIEPSYAIVLSNLVRKEIYASGKYEILNREDIKTILDQLAFELSDLVDDSNDIVKVGKALAVKKIVVGSIGKIENLHILTLKLVDIEKIVNEKIVAKSYTSGKTDIETVVRQAVMELTGKKLKRPSSLLFPGSDYTDRDYEIETKFNRAAMHILKRKYYEVNKLIKEIKKLDTDHKWRQQIELLSSQMALITTVDEQRIKAIAMASLRTLLTCLMQYYMENGNYPPEVNAQLLDKICWEGFSESFYTAIDSIISYR